MRGWKGTTVGAGSDLGPPAHAGSWSSSGSEGYPYLQGTQPHSAVRNPQIQQIYAEPPISSPEWSLKPRTSSRAFSGSRCIQQASKSALLMELMNLLTLATCGDAMRCPRLSDTILSAKARLAARTARCSSDRLMSGPAMEGRPGTDKELPMFRDHVRACRII